MVNREFEGNFASSKKKKDAPHATLAQLRQMHGIKVAEVFSMPRVTEVPRQQGRGGGLACDPKLGWNFDRAQDRADRLRR